MVITLYLNTFWYWVFSAFQNVFHIKNQFWFLSCDIFVIPYATCSVVTIYWQSARLTAVCLLKRYLEVEEKRKPLNLWLICTGVNGRGLYMMCSSSSGDWDLLSPWWKCMHECPFLTLKGCPSWPIAVR